MAGSPEYEKNLRLNNPEYAERQRQNTREWATRSPEKKKAYDRDYHLRRTYGITLEDYNRLLEEQGGVCAICKRAPSTNRVLAVDHCHKTLKVRGLLCINCNRILGFMDNEEWYAAALTYLGE
jgi:broad specificity phosphatase PhoE